jgi:hypothetical protein
MTITQHTPGPWSRGKYKNIVVDPRGYVVGVTPYQGYGYTVGQHATPEAAHANARLIAAAPQLLCDLEKAIAQLRWLLDDLSPEDTKRTQELIARFEATAKSAREGVA